MLARVIKLLVQCKLPSKRWRDLILRVWHVDPLRCLVCQNTVRVIAVTDDPRAVEESAWHDPPPSPPHPLARGPHPLAVLPTRPAHQRPRTATLTS